MKLARERLGSISSIQVMVTRKNNPLAQLPQIYIHRLKTNFMIQK
jgi:hypothetical protein